MNHCDPCAASSRFTPVTLAGSLDLRQPAAAALPQAWAEALALLPHGSFVAWGIPFEIRRGALLQQQPVSITIAPVRAPWLVFLHTTQPAVLTPDAQGFFKPARGPEPLGEIVATYTVAYADGSELALPIRRRHEIVGWNNGWPMHGLECVPQGKPRTRTLAHNQPVISDAWGSQQTRVEYNGSGPVYWLWAWRNPQPDNAITALRFAPAGTTVLIAAVSAGQVTEHPLRWRTRRKALLTLPAGTPVSEAVDANGNWPQLQLDLGQVISITPQREYNHATWPKGYAGQLPIVNPAAAVVEYTSHAEAQFQLADGHRIPVATVEMTRRPVMGSDDIPRLTPVPASQQLVTLRVVDKASRKPVPVRLHLHGQAGEYLAPVDRHRIPNPHWYQDYSVDYTHLGIHHATYIDGETTVRLPLGRVYLEVAKGFEIRPVRQVLRVTKATREIVIELEQVLPWRQKGWVTADTHVHFLSPSSALLEGAAEGVNVVNLLASQWGELMTNVGDFDGRTTLGSREAGGDGEYLVRVGTENRQAVLGHISLLGYSGRIIAPMTVGGPEESAMGDAVDCLLSDWAKQCRAQGGLVVLPHFPLPRAENATALLNGLVDGVEMTSWGWMYGGINPYSLSDWYRFLNCGYMTAAVAGTDKMSANTAIGTIRTYAQLPADRPFTYADWMAAVRAGRTFVTFGPLMEFNVDDHGPGSRLKLARRGGALDVTWELASVTTPMTRVELIVNGEIRESRTVASDRGKGHFTVNVTRSSWLALLVRGRYPDRQEELIAAHSSPVVVEVRGTAFGAAADTLTILEQIEGSLAYLDTLGTRAESAAYKRMRLYLTAAHRNLHNRMHLQGHDHPHAPTQSHAAHRRRKS